MAIANLAEGELRWIRLGTHAPVTMRGHAVACKVECDEVMTVAQCRLCKAKRCAPLVETCAGNFGIPTSLQDAPASHASCGKALTASLENDALLSSHLQIKWSVTRSKV